MTIRSQLADLGLSGVEESSTSGGVRLVSAEITGGRHDEVWRALRAAHPQTGLYPVLGTGAPEAAEWSSYFRVASQGRAALLDALTVDPAERMGLLQRSIHDEQLADFLLQAAAETQSSYAPELASRLGDMPPPGPGRRAYTGGMSRESILLVPAAAGYEVPVLVPGLIQPPNWFGASWHPDLLPVDHLAVLRLWQQRHGAELYYARGSTLELSVARPPRHPVDVALCAIEQMVYCEDLAQTVGDLDDVARQQACCYHWSFWWD